MDWEEMKGIIGLAVVVIIVFWLTLAPLMLLILRSAPQP